MNKTFLITGLMASVAFASNALAGGSCGDNCTWDLTDGVLTISGTGNMDAFSYDKQPWKDQIDSITSVQISNGITSIVSQSFRDATNLTSVTIPDSVTSIGICAFCTTSSLTSITIPDSVTSIGYNAFKGASSLTSITIPDTAALQVSPNGNGPFTAIDLNNVTLHCAGVLEQCKANMAAAGYANGTYNMEQAAYDIKDENGKKIRHVNADGTYYDYPEEGENAGNGTGGEQNTVKRRIYTVEEARQAVEAAGTDTVNFRIRYK